MHTYCMYTYGFLINVLSNVLTNVLWNVLTFKNFDKFFDLYNLLTIAIASILFDVSICVFAQSLQWR